MIFLSDRLISEAFFFVCEGSEVKRREGSIVIKVMLVVLLLAIVAAIAIPHMLKGRTAGSEASVINCLQTLIAVNRKYHSRFTTYAGSLTDLFDDGYIDTVFVSGTKAGYCFAYTGGANTWKCSADPEKPGYTGDYCLFVDQTGVIRVNWIGAASSSDPPID